MDTANATVNNAATASGLVTINNVSGNTWNENATGNKLVFNDPDAGTKLVLGSNASVASITLNNPAAVTIPSGATVGTLTVNAAGTTVTNAGTITTVEKNVDVEIAGNQPETVKPGPDVATLVGTQTELEIALNNPDVKKIVLKNNIETTSQVLIKHAGQTIDGAGYTISAASGMRYQDPNKSVVTVLNANDVKISNLTVDASKVNAENWNGVYAAQVYVSTGVTLEGVTLKNGDAGLLVNGSSVTVNNITTSKNEFGGIEVSQGTDVTSPAQLTVLGNSTHTNENVYIWTVGNKATVVDSAKQYKSGKDIRPGKEQYTNFILASEERDVPFTVVETPNATLGTFSYANNELTFSITTDKAVTLTAEEILSVFNYQFTKVGRTEDNKLARYDNGIVVGLLTEDAWKTTELEGIIAPTTEATDITFNEFNQMMGLRFAKDTNNNNFDGPNYENIQTSFNNNELTVSFPENFIKWDEIHGYKNNSYNITMHFNSSKLVELLMSKGYNVSNVNAQNTTFKMTLQGQAGGDANTPVTVNFIAK